MRDYILSEVTRLGLLPEVQTAIASAHENEAQLALCRVENIVVRLPGSSGKRRALLLMGHYDSVPTGPGASDDGHAVALLLETMRALKGGPQLESDVLFLFSDGEEAGLFGAKAFVASNPNRGDVELALNFEARGTRGPAFLFETTGSDRDSLARAFGRVAAFPTANSLAAEAYRQLPNDTDLTLFREAGVRGMNFAYFDGYAGYHSERDDIASLDPASLGQQGAYALSLSRYFAGGHLAPEPTPAATWFNLTCSWLVWYPNVLNSVVIALSATGLLALFVVARRRGTLSLRGVGVGFVAFLTGLVLSPLLIAQGWSHFEQAFGAGLALREPPLPELYWLAFGLFCAAMTIALLRVGARFAQVSELAVGALLVEFLLAAGLTAFVPGGAYLLVWPCLFGLIAAAALVLPADGPPRRLFSVLAWAGGAVAVFLMVPWTRLLFVLLRFQHLEVACGFVVVLLGFIVPQIVTSSGGARMPTVLSALGGVALLLGISSNGASGTHPRQDSIRYALDADAQVATWLSDDHPEDVWTRRLIRPDSERGPVDGFFPFTDWTFYQGVAPLVRLPLPELTVVDNQIVGAVRRLRVRVRSGGAAERVLIYMASLTRVRAVEVGGARFDKQVVTSGARWAVRYLAAPADGFDVVLETDADGPVTLRVVDEYEGLAQVAPPPRPTSLMEAPFGFGASDETLVGRSFTGLERSAGEAKNLQPRPALAANTHGVP